MSAPATHPNAFPDFSEPSWPDAVTALAAERSDTAHVSCDGGVFVVDVDGREVRFGVNACLTAPQAPRGDAAREAARAAIDGAIRHARAVAAQTGAQRRGLSIDAIAAAGYVVDGWKEFQQGYCGEYAAALIATYPRLRFGVIGDTEAGEGDASEGWMERHYFAHDDTYAYDSAGRHRLPYLGIAVAGEFCDYGELDADASDFGFDVDADGQVRDLALDHIAEHHASL